MSDIDVPLILLLVVIIIIIYFTGTYLLEAANAIGTTNTDTNLKAAYMYAMWDYYVTWILIAAAIVAFLLAIVYGSDYGLGEYFLLFLVMTLIVFITGLALAAAEQLSASSAFGPPAPAPLQGAYNNLLLSSGITSVTFVIFVILLIAGLVYSSYSTEKEYKDKYERILIDENRRRVNV